MLNADDGYLAFKFAADNGNIDLVFTILDLVDPDTQRKMMMTREGDKLLELADNNPDEKSLFSTLLKYAGVEPEFNKPQEKPEVNNVAASVSEPLANEAARCRTGFEKLIEMCPRQIFFIKFNTAP